MMSKLTCATMNLNKTGVNKLPQIHDLMSDLQCNIMALQEVDLNSLSCPGFVQLGKTLGLTICLSDLSPQSQVARVALVSSLPFRQVRFPSVSQPDRYCAGLIEFRVGHSIRKLLVCSIYGCASSQSLAKELVHDLVNCASELTCRWLILGDFNLLSGDLHDLEACGKIRLLDEPFGPAELLPSTGPGRRRRIDFGISGSSLHPTRLLHFQGLGDHLGVSYSFDADVALSGFSQPRRAPWKEIKSESVAVEFESLWQPDTFLHELSIGDTDAAWSLLSNVAEQLLCEQFSGHTVPRDAKWQPKRRSESHKASQFVESFFLRKLRRLLRRFKQLCFTPSDPNLCSNILRGIRDLSHSFPEISQISLDFPEDASMFLEALVSKIEKEEKQIALKKWKEDMHNVLQARQWVKRKAAAVLQFEALQQGSPLDPTQPLNAVHPAQVVQEAFDTWSARWTTRSDHPTHTDFQSIFVRTQKLEPGSLDVTEVLSAEKLFQRCKAMAGKASGPEDWDAAKLLHLPMLWWHALAQLWCTVLQTGTIPQRWKEATVVLLPKPDGGTRPLCLTSTLWRIGAACLAKGLTSWCSRWRNYSVMGGVPGCGVLDAHLLLQQAANCQDVIFVSEDLAKFFDSIDVSQVCAVLHHLGAPPCFSQLVSAFYSQNSRLFVDRSFCHPTWFQATRGLAQGCPLSPLLSATIMKIWGDFVSTDHIHCMTYIDDRTFWNGRSLQHVSPDEQVQELLQAKQRSSWFDKQFGLAARPEKCHIAAVSENVGAQILASTLGYTLSDHLKVLGVAHCVGHVTNTKLADPCLRKATLRLKFLEFVNTALHHKRTLIKTLVIPIFAWCSCVAIISPRQLNTIRQQALAAFTGKVLQDATACIKREFLGWDADPMLACMFRSLLFAVKFHTRGFTWNADPLPLGICWTDYCCNLNDFLNRHGWWCEQAGGAICRTDSRGHKRVWVLGSDRLSVIMEWMSDVLRSEALRGCRRIYAERRRPRVPQDSAAIGLTLPIFDNVGFCTFGGHAKLFNDAIASGDRFLRNAALASGASVWANTAGVTLNADDPRSFCICGASLPSRPHLVWCCPAFHLQRAQVTLPQNCVEERLFAKVVSERPRPPRFVPNPDISTFPGLNGARFLEFDRIFVATDGSEQAGVAALAVVFPQLSVTLTQGIDTEDQSPFRAEVEAIILALDLIFKTVLLEYFPHSRNFVIVSDCEGAIELVQRGSLTCPVLARRASHILADLERLHFSVEFCWVPSHGKFSNHFHAHPHATEDQLRDWNDTADRAANNAMKRRLNHSLRLDWHEHRCQAFEWECSAVRLSATIARQYADHIASLTV